MCALSTVCCALALQAVYADAYWKYADGLDLFEVLEGHVLEIDEFAAEDEMEQLRLTAV